MEDEHDTDDKDTGALREWGVPAAPLLGFKGRDAELRALEEAFASQSVVALWGEPGMGKTTLGVEFARRCNQAELIEGPILYSALSRRKTLSCILAELGVFLEIPLKERGTAWRYLTDSERRDEVLELLTSIRCFLIWDDAEAIQSEDWTQAERAELRAFLQELVRPGVATRVLVISQNATESLIEGLPAIELGGLSVPDRNELASALITVHRREPMLLQHPSMAELMAYVKGNPLALHILSLYWANREPDSLLELLQSFAREHHDCVLDTILSFFIARTTLEGKIRFAYLGANKGAPNTLVLAHLSKKTEIPTELQGLSLEDWQNFYGNLQIWGIVRYLAGVRYVTHPYVASFMYQQLQELLGESFGAFEDSVEESYAQYADFLGEQLRDNSDFDYEVLSDEEFTATFYFQRAMARKAYGNAIVFLHTFAHLWIEQSRARELDSIVEQIDTALEQNKTSAPPELTHLWKTAYSLRMKLAMEQREFDREREIHHRLIKAFEESGEDDSKAIALYHLGRIAHDCGELDEADTWYRQAMELAMRLGDEHQVARLLRQMGYVARDRRSFDSAEMLFLQSLKMQKRLGDEGDQILLTYELGGIARDRRSFADAQSWYRESGNIALQRDDKESLAQSLYQLGNLALLQKSYEEAGQYYNQSAGIYAELRDGRGLASALYQVGMVLQEQGQYDEAMEWYPRALEIFQRQNDYHGVARVVHQLGNMSFAIDDFEEAEQQYRFALELLENLGDEHAMAQTLHQLGSVARAKQKNAEALHYYQRAAAIFERYGDVPHLSTTRRAIMELEG